MDCCYSFCWSKCTFFDDLREVELVKDKFGQLEAVGRNWAGARRWGTRTFGGRHLGHLRRVSTGAEERGFAERAESLYGVGEGPARRGNANEGKRVGLFDDRADFRRLLVRRSFFVVRIDI